MDNNLVNDNLMPLDGRPFAVTEPENQIKEREQEVADTFQAIPVLKEVFDHLNERIAFYDSINSVPDEVLTQPEEFMHVIAANKLTVSNLSTERGYILSRIENASKR